MDAPVIAIPPPDGLSLLPRPLALAHQQARSDDHLVAPWLHGRSAGTQRAYAADLAASFAHARRARCTR